jgi:membrane-associated HD superfamily phosphohydrolase
MFFSSRSLFWFSFTCLFVVLILSIVAMFVPFYETKTGKGVSISKMDDLSLVYLLVVAIVFCILSILMLFANSYSFSSYFMVVSVASGLVIMGYFSEYKPKNYQKIDSGYYVVLSFVVVSFINILVVYGALLNLTYSNG